MINGFLIAFLIASVIGISIAVVIMVVLREITSHIYEGGGQAAPMRGFRRHLRRPEESEESSKKPRSRHTHYQA